MIKSFRQVKCTNVESGSIRYKFFDYIFDTANNVGTAQMFFSNQTDDQVFGCNQSI